MVMVLKSIKFLKKNNRRPARKKSTMEETVLDSEGKTETNHFHKGETRKISPGFPYREETEVMF